jgi:hypothetical protein
VGFKVRLSLLVLVVSAFVVVSVPAAQASLEIEKFVGINCKATHETCGENGEEPFGETVEPKIGESKEQGFTQAGGRVPYGVTDFTVRHAGNIEEGKAIPTSFVTHVRVDVAPGLATSPANVPQCTMKEFGETSPVVAFGFYEAPKCKKGAGPHETGPESTVIGEEKAIVYDGSGDLPLSGVLYNLEQPKPPHARAALYGAALEVPKPFSEFVLKLHGLSGGVAEAQYYAHTLVEGNVEWGKEAKGTDAGDFHDYFEVNVSPALPLIRSRQVDYGQAGNGAFITNGTACPGHHTTTLTLEGVPPGDEEEVKKSVESGVREVARQPYETLIGLQGCNGEEGLVSPPFEPAFEVVSGSTVSDQPTELTTEASEPQSPEEAVSQSEVKSASFTLPEGMTLDPSAAHGLEACTEAQAHQEGTVFGPQFGVECPLGSKIGTVSLNVPTLPSGSLTGSVYLGAPDSGTITGPPYKMYVVANSARYGVSVRLLGEVVPNPVTGQVTTNFSNPPEQPFTNLTLHFERAVLTSVANPLVCGTPQGSSSFTPTSAPGTQKNASFGVLVTGCAVSIPFAVSQTAEGEIGTGGGHTSFSYGITRPEGDQYLSEVKTVLPKGLVGEIPDVTLCEEAAANAGTCGAASKIGTVSVASGSGSSPYVFNGSVYMTGPYQGAPFGLSIVVPAIAGPFNLGPVVSRATININPTTAQVTAVSKLPMIVGGIPIRLRSLSVNVNRQGFLLNPTNCTTPLQTESTVTSTFGTVQTGLSSPFPSVSALEGCSSLAFKPAFTASTSGTHSKTNGASLVTTITQPAGQSNIKSVFVTLPKLLPSRLTTLQKACAVKTFEENPFNCKKEYEGGSEVGTAEAVSPTLPGVMKGPAILVSHSGEEFPSLELVLEDDNVRVIVEGKTDIKNGITTTNFQSTPDVPVSSITVDLPMGPHSALTTEQLNTNLCTAKLVMPTIITGQNGVVTKQNTVIAPTGCGVQIVGHKVVGNTAYITVETYAAGRISGSGSSLTTTRRTLTAASKSVTLKIPLTKRARLSRRRPFKVKLRVGFTPSKKGAKGSSASVTVTFRR